MDVQHADFVLYLRNKIETSVESLEKIVTAADKLLNIIIELERCKEDIQQWKDNLLSIRASAAQDLEAWENVKTISTEEKYELFQALPRLCRDDAEAQSYNLLSEKNKSKLNDLQKVAKTLQEHLSDLQATPVTSEERFDTAERSELSNDDVLRRVLSNEDVRKAFTSAILERRPSRSQAMSPFKDHMRKLPEVLDNLGAPDRSYIQKRDMSSLQGASTRSSIAKPRQKSPEFFRNFDDAPAHTRARKESKEHLPDVAAVPVGLGETFGTAERSELLGDDVLWKVSSNNDVRRALASARLERRPSRLQVISSATDPIRRLPEVLDILGAASLGDIQIRDMSSFWGASTGSLITFIEKYGHKVTEFYGTYDDASALTSARGKLKVTLGVGVSATDDIHQFPQSNAVLQSISFNGALPSIIENCGKPKKWSPTTLHFPELQSGDQVYVAKLLEEYFGTKYNLLFHYVYLPRCQLTEDDMTQLLKHCKQSLTICCESASLTSSARSRLDNLARQIYVTMHWNLNPANM